MTFETGIDQNWSIFPGMAVRAAVGIWRMENISNQFRPITAVRIVAGAAVTNFRREIRMLLPDRGLRMTAKTESLLIFQQKVGIGRLMRRVTGAALALGVRGMGIFECLRHLLMTAETGRRWTILEQASLI